MIAIDGLIHLIKKFGATLVMFAIMLSATMIMFNMMVDQNKKLLSSLLNEQEKVHSAGMSQRFNANSEVATVIENLLDSLKATRIVIGEYHNGNKNITGLPFCKFTISYEIETDSVHPIANQFKDVNISNFKILTEVNKNYFVTYKTDELKGHDKLLYYMTIDDSIKSVIFCELRNQYNPIGFIMIEYRDKNEITTKNRDEICKAANTISTMLSLNTSNKIYIDD